MRVETASRRRGASDPAAFHKPLRDTLQVLPQPGRTSNCVSKYSSRRRPRRLSTAMIDSSSAAIDCSSSSSTSCFFVESPTSVDAIVTDTNTSSSVRNRRATTTDLPSHHHRPPTTAAPIPLLAEPLPKQQQRFTEPAQRKKSKAFLQKHKRVAFKDPYLPEVIPDHRPPLQSYDELLFNVAGLYHTRSYLHDPDYAMPEDGEEPLLLERSLQLMVAEFLYRSAVYLGLHPEDDNVWVPGFRGKKKFSTNDVMRWRRLAHFDWTKEEQLLREEQQQQQQRRRRARSTSSASSSSSSSLGLRATVSQWFRRSPKDATASSSSASDPARCVMPPLERSLPPMSPTADLSRLVEVANSCISYGGFRFSEKSVRKLCNVPIKK